MINDQEEEDDEEKCYKKIRPISSFKSSMVFTSNK